MEEEVWAVQESRGPRKRVEVMTARRESIMLR